jgi:hypothetical protein
VACGLAEVVGMVAAASAFLVSAAVIGDPRTPAAAAVTILVIVVGGVVEGVAVGTTQWWLLRTWLTSLSALRWIGATVLVAAAGWLLGAMPSVIVSLADDGVSGSSGSTAEPSRGVMVIGGVVLGAVLGIAFGGAQALVLRRVVTNAAVWVYANACGWAAAMGVMFFGASAPDTGWSAFAVLITAALTGVVAGMSVGAVTGVFLPRLTPRPTPVVSG